MVQILVALLLFVLGYSLSGFLLSKVKPVAPIAEVLSIVIGVVVSLLYLGVL